MKINFNKSIALMLVLVMMLSLFSGCSQNDNALNNGNVASTNVEGNNTNSETEEEISDVETDEYVYEGPYEVEELGSGDVKWSEEETKDGFYLVMNNGGPILSYSKESGTNLIQLDGFAFKDLNKNGLLDQYEDWRETPLARAQNLSEMLTVEEMSGLMIHPSVFAISDGVETVKDLLDGHARTMLSFATSSSVEDQTKWINAVQAYTETTRLGIPVDVSTNPRTTPVWPDNLALAATFDPDYALEVFKDFSIGYRALGVTTLLGPQIDLASEPRWYRFVSTFGEDPALSRDMTNAAVTGHQSTYDENGTDLGWGEHSVNAMIKHWPSDGAGESGREAHDFFGKFNVYPGGQFTTGLIPFVDGGFNSNGATGSATAIMSSYSIGWSEDGSLGELEASAFNAFKNNLAREYGFDGVICSDWMVTNAELEVFPVDTGWGKTVETMNSVERVHKAIMSGTDQIGGLNFPQKLLEVFELGAEDIGEEAMMTRYRESSTRVLRNIFRVGLFENPFRDVENAIKVVGGEEAVAAGYVAQQKSAIMLKNDDNTIKAEETTEKATVYVPMDFIPKKVSLFGSTPSKATLPVELEILEQYFNVVTDTLNVTLTGPADEEGNPTVSYEDIIKATPEELALCDYAIVFTKTPENFTLGRYGGGHDGEKYIPISLQYGPYTADSSSVRTESVAKAFEIEEKEGTYGIEIVTTEHDMSYFGESAVLNNAFYLDMINYTVDNMSAEAKVIVAIDARNPMVVSEFESNVDAILMGFGIDKKVFLDIVTGKYEPSALLPMQMPASMEAIEAQYEDVPRDMEVYVDTTGNSYDFAFGLNWSGVINDERTKKYKVPALIEPAN